MHEKTTVFFILCFYFFSRAENNREKQAYRKNKPVQKIRAEKTSSPKTRVQKKQTYRKKQSAAKKHDPKKHFTIY